MLFTMEGLFVYGTLKSGEDAAHLTEQLGLLYKEPAAALGLVLYELPAGYPAAVLGLGRVYGEFLIFADLGAALHLLDAYEEIGQEYIRRSIWVEIGERSRLAWVYLYPSEEAVLRAGGRRIAGGRWSGHLRAEP